MTSYVMIYRKTEVRSALEVRRQHLQIFSYMLLIALLLMLNDCDLHSISVFLMVSSECVCRYSGETMLSRRHTLGRRCFLKISRISSCCSANILYYVDTFLLVSGLTGRVENVATDSSSSAMSTKRQVVLGSSLSFSLSVLQQIPIV